MSGTGTGVMLDLFQDDVIIHIRISNDLVPGLIRGYVPGSTPFGAQVAPPASTGERPQIGHGLHDSNTDHLPGFCLDSFFFLLLAVRRS
jgi:hypothetical protein